MGRQAAERFVAAREVFARVDTALAAPISRLCFTGPAEVLQETRWQQPAIFACSLAIHAAWQTTDEENMVRPVAAAGHSLGEYSALVAAGALELEDGARLVALRGTVMQAAADRVPGGMAVVLGLDWERVSAACAQAARPQDGAAGTVVPANDNAPAQQVISGGSAALERAVVLLKAAGARRVIPLKVAGAFHSPLMAGAVADLRAALHRTPLRRCTYPVIANSTGRPLWEPQEIREELARQITAPVRWVESLRTLAALAPERWIDCGPGTVMAGLVTHTVAGAQTLALAGYVDVAAPCA
jgi:[acyl-carrier-protein] S-malonyltransferase